MLEKDIQKSCHHRLDYWQSQKVVVHYTDLSNIGRKFIHGRWIMNTKKGTPDIVAYVKYGGICCVCFFEVKTATGVQSDNQIAFLKKFNNLTNVFYEIVRDPNQVDVLIERIVHFTDNKLGEFQL